MDTTSVNERRHQFPQHLCSKLVFRLDADMGDWIDSLKLQHEKEALDLARLLDVRLHDATITHSKAQAFLALTLKRTKIYCEKLRLKFPLENRYHPFIDEERLGGFTLNGGAMPRLMLGLDLNLNAQRIDVSQRIKRQVEDTPFPEVRPPIDITVGLKEELNLHFLGKSHDTPESLAQALISYVCGIKFTSQPESD
jgi:hypothetical protein